MAKVIRNCWVYKPHNHWLRYLPRRNDAHREMDPSELSGTIEDFRRLEGVSAEPATNKLWVTWLHRDLAREPKWTRRRVYEVFGQDPEPGRMEIVLNEDEWNERLWRIKHLIELRPITFPDGEPQEGDRVHLSADGVCRVVQSAAAAEEIAPPSLIDESTHWGTRELTRQRTSLYHGFRDPFETNVYTPANISIVK